MAPCFVSLRIDTGGVEMKIKRCLYSVFMFVFALAVFALWIYEIAMFRQSTEPKTEAHKTTFEEINNLWTMNMMLNRYPVLRQTFRDYSNEIQKGTYVIPGLKVASSMRAGTEDVCTNMVPQSVCVVEDFLLIGAYCHTGSHYSVIYVLDKDTHEYIKTIVLPGRHHVGGIAYDDRHKMIWVSCYNNRAQANAFSLEHLEWYNFDIYPRPIKFKYETNIYTVPKDSLMTYYNGYLYIGYFQVDDNSIIQKFKIDKDGDLMKVNSARYQQYYGGTLPLTVAIPSNVATVSSRIQGLAFYDHKMYISKSYGITQSKILVYRMKSDSQRDQSYREKNAINQIVLPQKLEQIMIDGDEMYSIYESGAYSYRSYSYPVIDRVIKMKMDTINSYGKR